ncbi:MAG TPA: hypothetical protein VGA69_01175 [Nitriliruptorales bacterium]
MTIRFALLGARPSDLAASLLGTAGDLGGSSELVLIVGHEPVSLPDDAPDITALQLPPELHGDDVAVDGWLLETLLSHAVDLLVTLGPGQAVGATTASTLQHRILTLEALPNGVSGEPSVLVSVRLWTADPDRPNPIVVQRTMATGEPGDEADDVGARTQLLLEVLDLLTAGTVDLDGLADA